MDEQEQPDVQQEQQNTVTEEQREPQIFTEKETYFSYLRKVRNRLVTFFVVIALFIVGIIFVFKFLILGFTVFISGPATELQDKVNSVSIQEESILDTFDWQTYRNEEYGFEFQLPPNWFNAEVEESKLGTDDTKIFEIKLNNEGVCNFTITTHDKWQSWVTEGGPMPTYLIENDNFVFSTSCGHDDYGYLGFEEYNRAIDEKQYDDLNSKEIRGPYNEFFDLIVPTFKFTEPQASTNATKNCDKYWSDHASLSVSAKFECEKMWAEPDENGYSRFSYYPEKIVLSGTYSKSVYDEDSDLFLYTSNKIKFIPNKIELQNLPDLGYLNRYRQVNFRYFEEVDGLFGIEPNSLDLKNNTICTLSGSTTIEISEMIIDNFEGGVPLSFRPEANLDRILEKTPYQIKCE